MDQATHVKAVICAVRYRLDPDRLLDFAEYGRVWVRLIEKHGGVHYGFFMPREAPGDMAMSFPGIGSAGRDDEALALFGFTDEEAYCRYRASVPLDPEAVAVIERFADPPFESYERTFLQPLSGGA